MNPKVGRLFTSLAEAMAALCNHYSQAELRVIVDYLTRSAVPFRRETRLLRAGAPSGIGPE
jgi:hypothetical protein